MKKLLTLACLACALVLMTSAQVFAQTTVSGVVIDSGGEALIGANILEKGTSNGTITDIDGTYSLTVSDGAVLVFSYTGFTEQEIPVAGQSTINVTLQEGELLDEVVVTGYGTQSKKEITSAVVKLDNEEFNQGAISDPAQLLQGKVAGLQVYNRGGDPNQSAVIRLRGISTVGANAEPLVVVDGIVGASLDNIDPNDIESVNVLKDGSAAAIYGSRGSSGVIIVTTKKGQQGDKINLTYNGQVSTSSPVNSIQIMNGQEFVSAGGLNLGSETDWIGEVTRKGFTHLHSIAASGGQGNTTFRVSANIRDVEGILKKSGFDQFNTRANITTSAFNDKLTVDFNTSLTRRNQENGFNEALRYAIIANPTAPIFGEDSPFPFASDQYGGYFELLGLFDFFNPVSLIEQNSNLGSKTEFNYGANLSYAISDNFTATLRIAEQNTKFGNRAYYPTTSNFRGGAASPIRKGLADFYNEESDFKLYEAYGTYIGNVGNADVTFTAGYSFQQNNFESSFFSLGDFPNNDLDWINRVEDAQDLQFGGLIGANSDASPDEKIIAFFGRLNVTIDGIFLNASVRREGSTKLGPNNQWGTFPAFGVGVDLNRYLDVGADNFKIRLGYGVTGALPGQSGLAQEGRAIEYSGGVGSSVSTTLTRAANPDLKWEEKKETNLGVEFNKGRFGATLDLYNRDIQDFILERTVDAAVFGVDRRVENAGRLNTKGLELAINYDVIANADVTYNTGVVLSSYKSTLEEYVLPKESRGQLGAPGQNSTNMILVQEGGEIGNIWGPVYTGVDPEGNPIFADVNGDGTLITGQDNALDDNVDFAVLGNGIPDLEIGWTNTVDIGDWSINAFFRGAFGHSLVNTFRAFYEPQLASQSSYNFMNTSLAVPELTTARFSSLYVEKADFFKLDNISVSRNFVLSGDSFQSMRLTFTAQNPFVITSYTGTDPEPSLVDSGAADNGGDDVGFADVLAPGIDRRNNYFASRSFTLGVQLNF